MTDRLCKLMQWEPGTAHKFEIIRQTCGGKAAALSIEKGNQLADKLEELMKSLCDHELANIGQEFLDGMAEPVTVECPFCQTSITKDSEACCIPMIACKAISDEVKASKPRFTAHEHDGEWVLRVHHPNGSYAGIGVLNGEIEAKAVCKTLNESVASDSFEESRWMEYFA